MDYNSSAAYCNHTVTQLLDHTINSSLSSDELKNLLYSCSKGYESEANDKFSAPLVWIGGYIAIASWYCIFAMLADLIHGIRKEVFQIPCKYFSLNAASITAISVAVKLTLDMTGSMPGFLDQAAKVGSIAFMCIMMANLMPSLASMDNKTLAASIIGLVILVITIIVNILIGIWSGVIGQPERIHGKWIKFAERARVYIGLLLLLLLISISVSLTVPSSNKILEFKYQIRRKALNSQLHLQHTRMRTVDEVREHVSRYWIMAKSGNPQFVFAGSILYYASVCICLFISIIHLIFLLMAIPAEGYKDYQSDYKWSIPLILITQIIGIIIGTFSLFVRGIKSIHFKNTDYVSSGKIYWTDVLREWKQIHTDYLSIHRRTKTFVHEIKRYILNLCIVLQLVVSLICTIIGLGPLFFCKRIRDIISPGASRSDDTDEDLKSYILQLEDEVQTSQSVFIDLSQSMNLIIQKAEKQQNNNLLELLGKFKGFKGVKNFDTDEVPEISQDQINRLIKSVDEALWYTLIVEKSFNGIMEYVNISTTTMTTLWNECTDISIWGEGAFGGTPMEILYSYALMARSNVEVRMAPTDVEQLENFPDSKLIALHYMHRISQSILSVYQNEIELSTNNQFFQLLSSMIADILCACFTNIPQVIMMKCHSDAIEKREASVEAAVKLLGRTTHIIRFLEAHADQLPRMDQEKRASIEEWRHGDFI